LDLANQRKVDFRQFKSVVLDEVDRMLDMGFVKDIQKMISQLPFDRQSLFFSATMTNVVMNVMKKFTPNPVTISVKTQESALGKAISGKLEVAPPGVGTPMIPI
jgi:superfamily II DNA/RNA helicase